MYITNINQSKEVFIDSLEGVKNTTVRWLLPPEIGVPNFEMRYFEIKEGGHTLLERHPWEHEVFIVKGEGIVRGKDKEKVVKFGDAVFIAPNEIHQFRNAKQEAFGFICLIPKGAAHEALDKKFKPKDLLRRQFI